MTILGCASFAAARASRWKHLTAQGDFVAFLGRIFIEHYAVHAEVSGLVNVAHSAMAEPVKHRVVADDQVAEFSPGRGMSTWNLVRIPRLHMSSASCSEVCGRADSGSEFEIRLAFIFIHKALSIRRWINNSKLGGSLASESDFAAGIKVSCRWGSPI